MNECTHIGLDVHKDTIAVAVLRPGTTGVGERVVPNHEIERLLKLGSWEIEVGAIRTKHMAGHGVGEWPTGQRFESLTLVLQNATPYHFNRLHASPSS